MDFVDKLRQAGLSENRVLLGAINAPEPAATADGRP
jgi:hypothetical protein